MVTGVLIMRTTPPPPANKTMGYRCRSFTGILNDLSMHYYFYNSLMVIMWVFFLLLHFFICIVYFSATTINWTVAQPNWFNHPYIIDYLTMHLLGIGVYYIFDLILFLKFSFLNCKKLKVKHRLKFKKKCFFMKSKLVPMHVAMRKL